MREVERAAVARRASRNRIVLDAAIGDRGRTLARLTPSKGAQARLEFRNAERLAQVVVGTGVEAGDRIGFGDARRQH